MHFSIVGLVENGGELFRGDFVLWRRIFLFAVLVLAGAARSKHLQQLLVGHGLVKLFRYRFKVVESNFTVVVNVEQRESFLDFRLMVLLTHLGDHDVKELSEVNTVALVLREFSDQFRQVIL